ncbi:MAG: hypothetical protein EXR62_05700 [Chloroflexi bacterium]|nr:hypothetical protein [Chloroflexota bacterium]
MSHPNFSPWQAYLIVFVSSFCTLVLELVAGRILAPILGVSLYTWTTIIGVVLAGISLGNFLGGRLADRFPYRVTIGVLLLVSGLAALSTLSITHQFAYYPPQLSLLQRIIAITAGIFFLPSLMLGTISPVLARLLIVRHSSAGQDVGRLYAISTAGSLVGTFVTGYFLIASFGTRWIIVGVAATLVLIALLFGGLWQQRRSGAGAIAGILLFAGGLWWTNQRGAFASDCLVESNYYCINVRDTQTADNRPMKTLALDHLVHSFVMLDDPKHLEYGYEQTYAEVTRLLAEKRADLRFLMIGAGGYTFPRYVRTLYPESKVEAVEIDPAVTRVAYQYLALDPGLGIITHNEDARQFFLQSSQIGGAERGAYDLILIDAFNDLSVPYHLTTQEFSAQIALALRPGGVLMTNIIDNYYTGEFLQAYAKSLRQVFPYVYLIARGAAWDAHQALTWVVLASDQPLDQARFNAIVAETDAPAYASRVMPDAQFEEYIGRGRFILTDKYAPVDNLIIRLFEERGF